MLARPPRRRGSGSEEVQRARACYMLHLYANHGLKREVLLCGGFCATFFLRPPETEAEKVLARPPRRRQSGPVEGAELSCCVDLLQAACNCEPA